MGEGRRRRPLDHIEFNALVMSTRVVADQQAAIEGTAALLGLDPADTAASPILLVGSPDQIVYQLEERRERWGFATSSCRASTPPSPWSR